MCIHYTYYDVFESADIETMKEMLKNVSFLVERFQVNMTFLYCYAAIRLRKCMKKYINYIIYII